MLASFTQSVTGMKSTEVKGERFAHMIKQQLIPDIQRKLLGYDCVYVQMDGAKAHVKAWDEIEELAATRIQMHGQKTPIIRFVVFVVCFTLVECRSRLRGASERAVL